MDSGVNEPPVTVVFVLLPGSLVLDWAGPAEALRIANACLAEAGRPPGFVLQFIGPQPEAVGSVGVTIAGLAPLPSSLPAPAWLVLLGQTGDTIDPTGPGVPALLHWLRGLQLQPQRLELLTVCAGAVLGAHAGLLDGRQATTHHHHLAELQAVAPRCDVLGNRVYVLDGAVSSSAGVSTGIDLFLHRIAARCGALIAAQVAQRLVVALRRNPGDPELSPFLRHRNHLHAALHRVQDAVSSAPGADWSLVRLAAVACTSPRHLSRVFATHAGVTPLQYVELIRLSLAEAALGGGRSVTQAAELAGFRSDTQLRRAWRRHGREGTPSRPG
jgi:transcriptional regulator GlxA family with amidase domain